MTEAIFKDDRRISGVRTKPKIRVGDENENCYS